VTLTGAGGAGKTRLALHVAAGLLEAYPGGVRLVELAPLAEPALVPQAVGAALGAREAPGRPLADTLVQAVGRRRLLLVLDNCEHLVDACAALADALLRACPALQILATSREALGVPGETAWPVPPLSVPPAALPLARLAESEAVRLFTRRAQARSPGFALTEANAAAVAEVCRRLDGLPLALELAAARVSALSVQQIAARLDDHLRLLTAGRRVAPPHQQTLRASVDWSYELLAEPERRLLDRLAVFAGGWTLEAAEAVGAGPGPEPLAPGDVLDVLARLVDKSLVVAGDGAPAGGERRYALLETVRQYAWERLAAGGDAATTRARHAAYFLDLAEAAEPALNGPDQAAWLTRLDAERENLRAALAWSLEQDTGEPGLRLAAGLWRFWVTRGYLTEGQQWLDRVLSAGAGAPPARRAKALNAAGNLARVRGDARRAAARHEESLALRRALRDTTGVAASLTNLGNVALDRGDFGRAARLYEESLAHYREAGDRWGTALALNNLGVALREHGDPGRAAELHDASLASRRALGDRRGVAETVDNLGRVALDLKDWRRAEDLLRESLAMWRELGERPSVPMTLEDLARAAAALDDPDRAARLWGAAEALRATLGVPAAPYRQQGLAAAAASARARLGEARFARAWAGGRAMTADEAIAYALSGGLADSPAAPTAGSL
jgi:non-specific serine/threonine protein kinase